MTYAHVPTCKTCEFNPHGCHHDYERFRLWLWNQELPPVPLDWKSRLHALGMEQAIIQEGKINYFHPAPEKDWDCGLITINPPVKLQTVKYLKKVWDQILMKDLGCEYQMCIEQRSTDPENFSGYHMHIAVKRVQKLNGNSYKKFLSYIQSCASASSVHFKTCQVKLFNNFINYLKKEGERDDEQKQKSIVDKKMREFYGLENIMIGGGGGGIN